MITPMAKLEILILREDLKKVVALLHRLGLLHIEQSPLTEIMEQRGILRVNLTSEQEKEKVDYETLLKDTDELIQQVRHLPSCCLLGISEVNKNIESKSFQELTDIVCNKLKPLISSIAKKISILKDELEILPRYKEILEVFALSKREIKAHENMACLALIFDARYEKDMDIFKNSMEYKTKTRLEVYTSSLSQKKIVSLLFYSPEVARQIDEEIFKKGTIKIDIPGKLLTQPLAKTIQSIESQLQEIPVQIEKLNEELSDFAKENLPLICAIRTTALNRLEEITVDNYFLQSKYIAVITGWLPKQNLKQLNQVLEESIGENFVIYDRSRFVKQAEDIPVLLDNPKLIRPYELLLRFFPLPKYGTMDATGLLSIFFPIFFGLIVGDIGYGLIFLVISLFLRKSAKIFIRPLGSILLAVSLSSIFFGALYGEFFGNIGKEWLKLPHILFDRHESVIPFLILALSVGMFHIVLGFLLGIIEAMRKKHKKEGTEKIAILGGLTALFLLVGVIAEVLPSGFLPPSIVLLAIVTILLIALKGFLGPLELISAVANILSYARLMALGLAGVMMASIANHIGGLPENVFIGIIVASLLHALNLVLSVFSPTVQSLRLHYVEFFSKFYEPGGKKYNPFRKQEVIECVTSH